MKFLIAVLQEFHLLQVDFSHTCRSAIEDMSDLMLPNGVPEPRTPTLHGLSLTEYTANPSPPSEKGRARSLSDLPDDFLLPNGYPDVRMLHSS